MRKGCLRVRKSRLCEKGSFKCEEGLPEQEKGLSESEERITNICGRNFQPMRSNEVRRRVVDRSACQVVTEGPGQTPAREGESVHERLGVSQSSAKGSRGRVVSFLDARCRCRCVSSCLTLSCLEKRKENGTGDSCLCQLK